MPRVSLGLGSNKGLGTVDGRTIIAESALALRERIANMRLSSLYISDPLYVVDQPLFINAAAVGDFEGSAYDLLAFINDIEARFGRDRAIERRRGERSLDIDILLYGDSVIADGSKLTIPHEGLLERKFALLPLLELSPDSIDPRDGKPLADAYAALKSQGIYYADLPPYNNERRS
ncbi:MAG: 2-amino-4-hydroxy-6-hydroxymethyldihydropteridine diphosphokinase [Treponemataceae bacterium]